MRELKGWDSNFSKDDFLEGAITAAVTISSMLQQNDWKELRGLLIRKEFKRLQTEVETEWSDVQRHNVGFMTEDIQSAFITDIRTQTIVQKRYCDIYLRVSANSQTSSNLTVIVDMSLHREYTEGCLPDWMVTRYHVSWLFRKS